MKKKFRLFGAGAATVGAMAGVAALTLPQSTVAEPGGQKSTNGALTPGRTHAQMGVSKSDGSATTNGQRRPDVSAARSGKRWQPITHGLHETPANLLPDTITRTRPVRVVSTTLNSTGSPVITARTATDPATATKLVRAAQQTQGAIGVELDSPVRIADVPTGDDPLRPQQWDLSRTNIPAVWSQSTGAGVTVAVVDTGVDSAHPDLTGQVLPGGDFITGAEGQAIDPNGHGTHVAGTIAAIVGNNTGISGIAPNTKILPVRVLGANGGGYMSTAAAGVVYAADHGADVINLSLSATTPTDAMTNAVAYARSKNVVVVAAAGNARAQGSPVAYPAASAGVIAVAATDPADNPASFSNQGGYVDVAAPGSGIVSTFPGAAYRRMSGTSMAAPHVAAVAALIRSQHSTLTPDQVESALETSAIDLGAAGRDDDFGAGLVNAAAALTALAPLKTPAPAQTPAAQTPPADGPAPQNPPAETPAAETPPAQSPPTQNPPAETPPAQSPPADNPPAQSPPTHNPPADNPPDQSPPTHNPPAETPPAQSPPTQNPPAETPPAQTPAGQNPPAPTPSARNPVDTRPAAEAMIVRTAARQLTVGIRGAEGQLVELQRDNRGTWETVFTYRAVLAVRLNNLPTDATYRIVVGDGLNYRSATSNLVSM